MLKIILFLASLNYSDVAQFTGNTITLNERTYKVTAFYVGNRSDGQVYNFWCEGGHQISFHPSGVGVWSTKEYFKPLNKKLIPLTFGE